MNFTLIDDDCTVADLFVWISFQKLHDWFFFSSSHACQFQSLLNPYSQNLEFVYERLCCGRSIFFLSRWKWKFLWWNLKNRHGFLFFFFFFLLRWQTPLQIQIRMASLGKYVFVPRGKSNASFMAIFACFVLFLCMLWPFLYGCTF